MNAEQKQLAQAILERKDNPSTIDHSEDSAVLNVRTHVRSFIQQLCEVTGAELPVSWPQISPDEYASIHHTIEQAIQSMYTYVQGRADFNITSYGALRITGESALGLLRLDGATPSRTWDTSSAVFQRLASRPYPELQLDQLYCTPDSTERRCREVALYTTGSSSRILCLGDDDLCSLVFAQNTEHDVHAYDFDTRLLEHIRRSAPQVTTQHVDLIQSGMPTESYEAFDAVILDPPWDEYGLWNFLDKALFSLAEHEQARIFLSFCPLYLEHIQKRMYRFWRRIAQRGLILEQIQPYFHLYSLKGTPFLELLQGQLPTFSSPLLDVLKALPYGFSHLYTLRRNMHKPMHPLYKQWFKWWHSA